jgi:hypothetical protein
MRIAGELPSANGQIGLSTRVRNANDDPRLEPPKRWRRRKRPPSVVLTVPNVYQRRPLLGWI